MKLLQHRYGIILGALAILGLILVACAPNADARLISPQLGAQLYAEEADQEVAVEPTPEPVLFTSLAPEQVTAGLDAEFAAALAAADPGKGEAVALANGCTGCHNLDPNVTMTGPTWHNLADTASNRVPGESPALYIHDSIVNPNAYVVPNYPSGVMPQTYAQSIAVEDLANLVAYLLAHHQ